MTALDTALDATAVASPPIRPRGRLPVVLWRAGRPEQWIKNLLVLSAPLAGGVLLRPSVVSSAALVVLAFILAACAGYLVNDVLDVEADRAHPRKRLRPVAAGDLSPQQALVAAVVLAVTAVTLAGFVERPALPIITASYLLITALYSSGLKRVPYLEVFVVASGFLLRALAGAVGTGVPPSRWFLVVCTCGALTLAFGKRSAELARVSSTTDTGRRVIAFYSRKGLAWCRTIAAVATVVAYLGWAADGANGANELLALLSGLPLAAALAVYIRRNDSGRGEAPEHLLIHDRLLQLLGSGWLVLFLVGVQVG